MKSTIAALWVAACAGTAFAQAVPGAQADAAAGYPNKPVRWVIPFKVKPLVANDEIRGARYGWIDKDGKFQGWFTPKKVE